MHSYTNDFGSIDVVSLAEAQFSHHKHDTVITIEDPDCGFGLRVKNGMPQLVLAFNDISRLDRHWVAPSIDHVSQAIEFARQHKDGKLLIHCAAGVSRSPAIALAIIADRLGAGRENEAVEYVFSTFKSIDPNERVVACADRILERDRALLGAFRRKSAEVAKSKPQDKFNW